MAKKRKSHRLVFELIPVEGGGYLCEVHSIPYAISFGDTASESIYRVAEIAAQILKERMR